MTDQFSAVRASTVMESPHGTARVSARGDGRLYLSHVMVDQRFRGRGEGTMLVQSVLRVADERKMQVLLHTQESTKDWYESLGFRRLPEEDITGKEMAMVRDPR